MGAAQARFVYDVSGAQFFEALDENLAPKMKIVGELLPVLFSYPFMP